MITVIPGNRVRELRGQHIRRHVTRIEDPGSGRHRCHDGNSFSARCGLGPADDATAVTAVQVRGVIDRLITAGHWKPGDPEIVVVADTGYDITRLAYVLADLPVQLVGRLRSDRVCACPSPHGLRE